MSRVVQRKPQADRVSTGKKGEQVRRHKKKQSKEMSKRDEADKLIIEICTERVRSPF
jgi:hypothetical protein